jgi:hypothetical protein
MGMDNALTMRRCMVLCGAAVWLVAGARAAHPEESPAAASTGGASPGEATTPSRPEADGGIKIIDTGSGPRQHLRYRLSTGRDDVFLVDLATAMDLAIGDLKRPQVRTPLVRMSVALQVSKASGDRYLLRGVLNRVEALPLPKTAPDLTAALRNDLRPLVGSVFTAELSTQGILSDVKMNLIPNAQPQLVTSTEWFQQALAQLVVPLPARAIGKTARWSRQTSVIQSGIKVEQTTQYQLTQLAPKKIRVSIDVIQLGREQSVSVSGLPPGADVVVKSFEGHGTGSASIDLATLSNTGTIKISGTAEGTARSAGEPPDDIAMKTMTYASMRPARK